MAGTAARYRRTSRNTKPTLLQGTERSDPKVAPPPDFPQDLAQTPGGFTDGSPALGPMAARSSALQSVFLDMARRARLVIPDLPHHVVQRGVRRMAVFWDASDYATYLRLLRRAADRYDLRILTYCLMPNHVHLIVVPPSEESLPRSLQWAHSRYAEYANQRHDWTGHLWQQRFRSAPMDEAHLYWAARYVLGNPVRSGLVRHATEWRWSAAAAHAGLRTDPLVEPAELLVRVPDVLARLDRGDASAIVQDLRSRTQRGVPLGEDRTFAGYRPRRAGPPIPGPAREADGLDEPPLPVAAADDRPSPPLGV